MHGIAPRRAREIFFFFKLPVSFYVFLFLYLSSSSSSKIHQNPFLFPSSQKVFIDSKGFSDNAHLACMRERVFVEKRERYHTFLVFSFILF